MPDERKFDAERDLAGYITVPERVARFYELYGQGRLVTGEVRVTAEPDGVPRVWVQGLAYRTPEDPLPGVGWSWMELPGKTKFTRGSELENTETSAWGRAIGALGILIDRSIATSTEIDAKAGEPTRHMERPDPIREATRADEPTLEGAWNGTGVIGINKKGPADGYLRQTPDGGVVIVTFMTVPDSEGKEHKMPQTVFRGSLAADVIDAAGNDLAGLVCTIEGDIYRVPFYPQPNVRREFQRLEVKRIQTASWALPAPEAPSVAMFDDEAEHALDALLP
jgi:hypothetical protein